MNNYFTVSYLILQIFLFCSAFVLLFPVRNGDERLYGYKLSRFFVAISYFFLGLYCIIKPHFYEMISFVFLFVASIQANLLALSHINMLDPRRFMSRSTIIRFVMIAVMSVLYLIIRCLYGGVTISSFQDMRTELFHPEVLFRLVWLFLYQGLIFFYIHEFRMVRQRYEEKALDFFADDRLINIPVIRAGFVIVIVIGFTAFMICLSYNRIVSVYLNYLILLEYIALSAVFIIYPRLFRSLGPVIADNDAVILRGDTLDTWLEIRERIVSKQLYCINGITLDDISIEACVCRSRISYMINHFENRNFNSFINALRIDAATDMIKSDPSIPTIDIVDRIGFSDSSQFSRHFKEHTGLTPSQFRQRVQNEKNTQPE